MKRIWLILPILILLLLAACATSQSGGGQVPGTGSTDVAPTTASTSAAPASTSSAGGGSTNSGGGVATAECTGVDTQALVKTGETYFAANCASCHGAQGEGQGDFPALANNAIVTAQDPVQLVTRFFSVPAHPKTITTDETAAVFTYLRSAFGNTAGPVCPDTVLGNRPAQ